MFANGREQSVRFAKCAQPTHAKGTGESWMVQLQHGSDALVVELFARQIPRGISVAQGRTSELDIRHASMD